MAATEMLIRYFESVDGYGAPLVPRNMIPENAIKARKTYYEVGFDNSNRVVRITKMLNGKFSIRFDYEYDGSGRVSSAKVTRRDGKTNSIPVSATNQPVTTRS